MITALGIIAAFLILIWASIFVYFVTVPTFGEALFSGSKFEVLIGALLWVGLFYGWFSLLDGLSWG